MYSYRFTIGLQSRVLTILNSIWIFLIIKSIVVFSWWYPYFTYISWWEIAVDVVITPGRQYKFAGFPLTESVDEAVHLLQILDPQVVLPIQLTHLEISGWDHTSSWLTAAWNSLHLFCVLQVYEVTRIPLKCSIGSILCGILTLTRTLRLLYYSGKTMPHIMVLATWCYMCSFHICLSWFCKTRNAYGVFSHLFCPYTSIHWHLIHVRNSVYFSFMASHVFSHCFSV